MLQRTLAGSAGLCAALVLFAPIARAADKVAVKAGRIITQDGPDITDGVILIENGRIQAIGADIEIPWDAEVVDGSDLVAFPGYVEAHTDNGMDRANENIDVTPFLSIRDSLDPVSFYFEQALRSGITTINVQQGSQTVIAGRGLVVRPVGMTVEEMLVRPDAGIKLSAAPKNGKTRATQAQALRRAFTELRHYLEGAVQDKKDGGGAARREAMFQGRDPEEPEDAKGRKFESSAAWTVAELELVPRSEIDEKQAPLLRLVEGKLPAWFYCAEPMDVHLALDVATENGFLHRTTLVLESACWKAADEIAERGVPVVLLPSLVDRERDPVTGEEIETFVAAIYDERGIPYAFASGGSGRDPLWFQAAFAVGRGLEREKALDAVTTGAADLLRLGDRVGSLTVGKEGNVLLLSGDPLSITTFVELVLIEGELVYDRSQDVRTRHLLEGVQPTGTSAPGVADQTAPGADDEEDGE
jgi:imidazolonepropionase-like amidohydrolase